MHKQIQLGLIKGASLYLDAVVHLSIYLLCLHYC